MVMSQIGDMREGREIRHRDHRQEEVPCPCRPHRRPVRLRNPEAHQALAREGHLHLRGRGTTADRCPDEQYIRGAQGRRRVSLHHVCLPFLIRAQEFML